MVEKTRINKDTKYKFGISFSSLSDDYSCLIGDVTTYTDQTLVDKFVWNSKQKQIEEQIAIWKKETNQLFKNVPRSIAISF